MTVFQFGFGVIDGEIRVIIGDVLRDAGDQVFQPDLLFAVVIAGPDDHALGAEQDLGIIAEANAEDLRIVIVFPEKFNAVDTCIGEFLVDIIPDDLRQVAQVQIETVVAGRRPYRNGIPVQAVDGDDAAAVWIDHFTAESHKSNKEQKKKRIFHHV